MRPRLERPEEGRPRRRRRRRSARLTCCCASALAHSHSDSEKAEAAGWGAEDGKKELEAEQLGDADAKAEKPADDGTATPVREAPIEEEDNTQTYEEYLAAQAEKKLSLSLPEARKANEGDESSLGKPLTKKSEAEEEWLFGAPVRAIPSLARACRERVLTNLLLVSRRPRPARPRSRRRASSSSRSSSPLRPARTRASAPARPPAAAAAPVAVARAVAVAALPAAVPPAAPRRAVRSRLSRTRRPSRPSPKQRVDSLTAAVTATEAPSPP